MKVRRLELETFTVHDSFALDLPATGLVVVTAANGKGKSSLIEAVSYAGWGKTLRGETPQQHGKSGSVVMRTDAVEATRAWNKKGAKTLVMSPIGDTAAMSPKHDTAVKAQAALEKVIGDHDSWRRRHVLSSTDADHFASADDEERKRVLERALGLDAFDGASDAVAADLRGARAELRSAELVLVETTVRHGEAKDAAARAKQSAGAGPKPAPPVEARPDVVALRTKLATAEAQEHTVAAERQAGIRKRDIAQQCLDKQAAVVDTLRRQLEAARAGRCELCGATTAEELVTKLHKEFIIAEIMARDLAAEYQAAKDAVRPEPNQRGEVPHSEQYRRKLAEATGVDAEWRSHDRELAAWEARAKAVKAEASGVVARLSAAAEALGTAEDRADELKAAVSMLECVQQVLGPRGARARLLADALGGVSQAATAWATRLFGRDVEVMLSPATEQKNGVVVAKLGLGVRGAGNGSYKSLSGGERRRVDVAILLALADVSSAARGEDHGTLWLDEVGDSLDSEGLEGLRDILQELAKERSVVLISHNPDLVANMVSQAVLRVHLGDDTHRVV